MTTTHTFHGLSTDSRPSSRVLNPPGGSTSNIFGCDSQMKQHSYVRSNQEMVSREKSDTVGQGLPTATAGPQQKSWAPRSAFNPITGELYEQPKPKSEPLPAAVAASESNTSINQAVELSTGTANTLDEDKVEPEPAVVEPAAVAEPPVQEKPQPTQSGRLFGGGSENVKEHRSTRVSQPPGGHSSKLW